MPDSVATPAAPETTSRGTLSAAIPNAVVGLLHDYTGRGPTRARTTIGAATIVVTLRDSLTKAERTPADPGPAAAGARRPRDPERGRPDGRDAARQPHEGRAHAGRPRTGDRGAGDAPRVPGHDARR